MPLERRSADNSGTPWKRKDETALRKYLEQGKGSINELRVRFPDRPLAGLRAKVRKLRIKHDLFGSSYQEQKQDFTTSIAQRVKPKTVFDGYAGAGHQTCKWIAVADRVYSAEKMKSKLRQFEATVKESGFKKDSRIRGTWNVYRKGKKEIHLFIGDAVDAAAEIRAGKIHIDLIDLDTCGSTLPLLPTLLVLVKPRHLVITHGEYHSMRFKRDDVLRRLFTHRDISETPFPLDTKRMGSELDKAVKVAALRAHNETRDSYWVHLKDEKWLGNRTHGMLRRYYEIGRPPATADCINELSSN